MKTVDLAYVALFAAVTAVLGLVPGISVGPVPITAQTLGVMLAGSVLGARRGLLALALFLVLVAIGLPLLPGGRGGLAVFAGPTAGFLLSWPVGAFVVGLLTEWSWARYSLARALVANAVGGILVVYLIGVPVLAWVNALPLGTAIGVGGLPFLPGDAVKAVVASVVAVQVRRSWPVIQRPHRAATSR